MVVVVGAAVVVVELGGSVVEGWMWVPVVTMISAVVVVDGGTVVDVVPVVVEPQPPSMLDPSRMAITTHPTLAALGPVLMYQPSFPGD